MWSQFNNFVNTLVIFKMLLVDKVCKFIVDWKQDSWVSDFKKTKLKLCL